MIDGDQGHAGRQRNRLGGHQPDDQAAGEPGPGGCGNAVEIGDGEPGLPQ